MTGITTAPTSTPRAPVTKHAVHVERLACVNILSFRIRHRTKVQLLQQNFETPAATQRLGDSYFLPGRPLRQDDLCAARQHHSSPCIPLSKAPFTPPPPLASQQTTRTRAHSHTSTAPPHQHSGTAAHANSGPRATLGLHLAVMRA